jgi:acyl-CoA-dependent ceramide synthase
MWGFLGALGFLQLLTIFWFFLNVKVAIRVVQGAGADDIRSEDVGGDTEEGENESEAAELAVPSTLQRKEALPRNTGSAGGSLTGHRDRKELLSRIGCEKQE